VNTRADWLSSLLSTQAADRPLAELYLREMYIGAGLAAPTKFFWFESAVRAAWAVALFTAQYDVLWQRIVDAVSRSRHERDFIEQLRAEICKSAGLHDWPSVLASAGEPIDGTIYAFQRAPGPCRSLQSAIINARMKLYDSVADATRMYDDNDDLHRAELYFRGVLSGQAGSSTIKALLLSSFSWQYPFSRMAMDEAAANRRTSVPSILDSAWKTARSAGPWWPFSGSVVVSDRPAEIYVNERWLLHRGEGPAVAYRDGTRLWAWNGHAMREEWIMHPENISPRELKEFDSTFREHVAKRVGVSTPKSKVRHSSILQQELPRNADNRVLVLRGFNNGSLPLFERYLSGEHEKVWQELIALGPAVREDPHTADALAVAYETMRRVDLNVREICARLEAIGYTRARAQMHEPPGRKAHQQIERLERRAGTLPLSLRAFYDVVGAVDWMGEHPSISPRNDSIAPDPLVVFSVEDALEQCKAGFVQDQGVLAIAPDDLHKANTSGGEPYEIAVPEPCADGKLLNERHNLYFVEYLRLVFRFGGFPGYDGIDPTPAELAELRRGLIAF